MSANAKVFTLMLIAAVAASACGSSSGPSGPTVAGVAVQSSDLPTGMARCDLSGDVQSFIGKEQGPDPQSAKTIASQWEDAKKNGATAAFVALYTDSSAHCAAIKGNTSDLGAATYRLVVNFVVQFKDVQTAASDYKGDQPIFGFSQSQLRNGAGGVVEGTKTGLTANSISLTQPVGNQLFYIAFWQNKAFMVLLLILNVDANAAKNAATRENGRIT
jgi:hypothetical protein